VFLQDGAAERVDLDLADDLNTGVLKTFVVGADAGID
jgi:hypothetical protein